MGPHPGSTFRMRIQETKQIRFWNLKTYCFVILSPTLSMLTMCAHRWCLPATPSPTPRRMWCTSGYRPRRDTWLRQWGTAAKLGQYLGISYQSCGANNIYFRLHFILAPAPFPALYCLFKMYHNSNNIGKYVSAVIFIHPGILQSDYSTVNNKYVLNRLFQLCIFK